MNGILSMLFGDGEKKNQEKNKKFNDAIPDFFPADMSIEERAANHPAYSGPLANTTQAASYRRAHHGGRGPQSKAEHAAFEAYQTLHDQYSREIKRAGKSERTFTFADWLNDRGIALPE